MAAEIVRGNFGPSPKSGEGPPSLLRKLAHEGGYASDAELIALNVSDRRADHVLIGRRRASPFCMQGTDRIPVITVMLIVVIVVRTKPTLAAKTSRTNAAGENQHHQQHRE